MEAASLARMATAMVEAQDRGTPLAPFSDSDSTLDEANAYAVAALIDQRRGGQGWRVQGRKLGFTNAAMWPRYNVSGPVWARLYDHSVNLLEGTTATVECDRYPEVQVEPEVVLHFARAPRDGASLEEILACCDWIAHGFEIVCSHFPGWRFRAVDTIIANGLHGALLVGPRIPASALSVEELRDLRIELACDGVVREAGTGSAVLGSPLAAVAHLLELLAAQADAPPLAAGELVTTGTLTPACRIHPGETWTTRLAGIALPGLSLACR